MEAADSQAQQLPCGCSTEFINNKFINILCDEHEFEYQGMKSNPSQYRRTKMKDYREN
jgi:hypothetical protein